MTSIRTRKKRATGLGRLGFTLLEVMVAIAILGLGIVVLLQIQSRSIMIAQEARTLTVATMLARSKMYDCQVDLQKKGFSIGDYREDGRFDEEGYDQFFWECHGYQPDLPVASAADITQAAGSAGGGGGAGGIPGLGGAGGGAGGGLESIGVGMIAPVVSQLSSILKESVRELVVIVRWKEGRDWNELRVATHLTDLKVMQGVAQSLQQATQGGGIPGLGSIPGLSGGGAPGGGGQVPNIRGGGASGGGGGIRMPGAGSRGRR